MPGSFTHARLPMPNRNGFNMDHSNLLSMKVGGLIPILCAETLPNETYNLRHAVQVNLPPMATDFYGRVNLKIEAFFVPNRIIWGGWQNFISNKNQDPNYVVAPLTEKLPGIIAPESICGPTTLADYLGFTVDNTNTSGLNYYIRNCLPFLAYHKIYDDWYRDARIQKPLFVPPGNGAAKSVRFAPWQNVSGYYNPSNSGEVQFYDGSSLMQLRTRNYAKDYFTNCTPRPQSSTSQSVGFSVYAPQTNESTLVGTGSFTIAQLRSANSIQEFMERNNIAANNYSDSIRAHFGIYPADAITDRPIFLGSDTVSLYNKSVYQNGNDTRESAPTQNPFMTVGTKFGNMNGFGEGGLIDNYKVTEHGFIMVLASIVPESYYETGVRRYFSRIYFSDYAFPALENIGDQPLYADELDSHWATEFYKSQVSSRNSFGYTQRFAEFKYIPDQVHGVLREGQSLSNFAIKRGFNSTSTTPPTINSDFLKIPVDAMDDVSAVAAHISHYGAWCEFFFDFKKVSPLAPYSIPSLGLVTNSHLENVPLGSTRL